MRLNAPIKPALDLDAQQLALVVSEPERYPPTTLGPVEEPDIEDAGAQLLHAVLSDHMIEAILTFCTINQLFAQLKRAKAAVPLKKNGRAYQVIEAIFASPSEPGLLGHMAEKYYDRHYGKGWRFLSPFTLLGRLLGNNSKSWGELLSWLFFEPTFLQDLIKKGQVDAEQRLKEARKFHTFPFNKEN